MPDAQVPLFARIVRTAVAQQDRLDSMIAEALPADWPMARLDPVLRAMLRAGGAELSMADGPPSRVVINEYLDVAHGFFTGDEPRMVNGLLDRLARLLRPGEFGRRSRGVSEAPRRVHADRPAFPPARRAGRARPPGRRRRAGAARRAASWCCRPTPWSQGVHFLPDDPADLVGRKLLRVNLSDLAAKGADAARLPDDRLRPRGTPDAWFAGFAAGLAADQARIRPHPARRRHHLHARPAHPVADHPRPRRAGPALRRTGAQPGDEVWVTGTIGDGALGLRGAAGEAAGSRRRTRPPLPPAASRAWACTRATSCTPAWMCPTGWSRTSAISAAPQAWRPDRRRRRCRSRPPRAPPARAWLETCLTGGDDYELVMAVAPEQAPALAAHAASLGVRATRIGHFAAENPGVRVLDGTGQELYLARTGWSHF